MKTLFALFLLLPVAHAFAAEEMSTEVTQIHQLMIRGDVGVRGGTDTVGSGIMLDYALRVGVDVGSIHNFARLVPTVAYHYSSIDYFFGAYDSTIYSFQFKFKDVADTGLYFAPTIGMASIGTSIFGFTDTQKSAVYGALFGYEFYRHSSVSFGPEVEIANLKHVGTYTATFGVSLNLL